MTTVAAVLERKYCTAHSLLRSQCFTTVLISTALLHGDAVNRTPFCLPRRLPIVLKRHASSLTLANRAIVYADQRDAHLIRYFSIRNRSAIAAHLPRSTVYELIWKLLQCLAITPHQPRLLSQPILMWSYVGTVHPVAS